MVDVEHFSELGEGRFVGLQDELASCLSKEEWEVPWLDRRRARRSILPASRSAWRSLQSSGLEAGLVYAMWNGVGRHTLFRLCVEQGVTCGRETCERTGR